MKDYDKFANEPDQVCYVPELAEEDDEPITRNYIVELCGGDLCKAEMIFELCEWEHPATVLERWDEDDEEALNRKKKLMQQCAEAYIESIKREIKEQA
ncbi:MAG: hypothetical protein PHE79_09625 [Eubacteriales bacterium]|nr:hypothetical protein [Eubacteriales bacterium]